MYNVHLDTEVKIQYYLWLLKKAILIYKSSKQLQGLYAETTYADEIKI